MVIKGKSVAGAARLAKHLERTDTNERMEVKELRGVAAEDLRGALREMEAVASACPNCEKPFYHASINTRADERLTDAQRMQSIDRLEKELGLTGQPRAVVVHEKEGREHCHIVWTRIDIENLRTISDSFNYRKHELVARELEREFGHERVQGAHIEREGVERPKRTPSHREHQQAERTGIPPRLAQAHITKIWQQADSGAAFAKGLEESGWILARGDRRDFVVVDPKGGTHSLARRIEGAKVKDVRARLADVDIVGLPSVAEAKAAQRATPTPRELQQAARTGISPQQAQAHVTRIRERADTGAAFAKGLEKSGWILARGNWQDFVVIDPKGGTHNLARWTDGTNVKSVRERLADVDISRLPSVAEAKATQRPRITKSRAPVRIIGGVVRPATQAAGGALNAAAKVADGAASLFENLMGAGSAPKKRKLDDTTHPLDAGAVVPPTDEQERLEREQQSARRAKYLQDFSIEVTHTKEIKGIERIDRSKGRERERDR
jgi:Relaxase/Mobilisation nuclease domain